MGRLDRPARFCEDSFLTRSLMSGSPFGERGPRKVNCDALHKAQSKNPWDFENLPPIQVLPRGNSKPRLGMQNLVELKPALGWVKCGWVVQQML